MHPHPAGHGANNTISTQFKAITIMLSNIILAFVLLTLPHNISVVTGATLRDPLSKMSCFLQQMSLTNNIINFPVYCLSCKSFREQFFKMMECKKPSLVGVSD